MGIGSIFYLHYGLSFKMAVLEVIGFKLEIPFFCWTAIKQTTNQLSQLWLSWFVVCLIAVQQNDDPGPWQWKVLGSIPGVVPVLGNGRSWVRFPASSKQRGALSQLYSALAAVQLYNSVVRGLELVGRSN